ncbi:37097_t:CDS:1, partial [Racocetra persica]
EKWLAQYSYQILNSPYNQSLTQLPQINNILNNDFIQTYNS